MAEYKKRRKLLSLVPVSFNLIRDLDFEGKVTAKEIPGHFLSKFKHYFEVKRENVMITLIRKQPIDFNYRLK